MPYKFCTIELRLIDTKILKVSVLYGGIRTWLSLSYPYATGAPSTNGNNVINSSLVLMMGIRERRRYYLGREAVSFMSKTRTSQVQVY